MANKKKLLSKKSIEIKRLIGINVYRQISNWVKKNNTTIIAFAYDIGMSKSSIDKINWQEDKKDEPSLDIDKMLLIAEKMNISLADLLDYEKSNRQKKSNNDTIMVSFEIRAEERESFIDFIKEKKIINKI